MDIDLELVKIVDGAPEAIGDGVASGVYDSGNHKSNSRVDNIEMISIRGLAPGEYAIRMDRINNTTTTSGGLAWLFIESDEGPIGDFNGDFLVDGQDLAILLSAWGTDDPDLDINGDGIIGGADLAQLLSNWSWRRPARLADCRPLVMKRTWFVRVSQVLLAVPHDVLFYDDLRSVMRISMIGRFSHASRSSFLRTW